MFFSVVVDNVFELGVNLLVNLHFCVQGLHSSRFSMWGSQNGKYLVKCGKCGRWGFIQWDSTGLYWIKCKAGVYPVGQHRAVLVEMPRLGFHLHSCIKVFTG